MFRGWLIISLSFFLAQALAARAETELLMFEETNCYWCLKWEREIADIYPKTTEGKIAPVKHLDIRDVIPSEYSLKLGLNFTPTFVLVHNGKEQSRIEGYPGEDFFWGLLGRMLQDIETTDKKETH